MRWVAAGVVLACVSSASAHESINHEVGDLSEALSEHGPVVSLLVVRARLWLLDGAPSYALADVQLAELIEPDHPELPIVRAMALRDLGRPDEALAVLESETPSFAGHRLQGEIHESRARLTEALAHYESAASFATVVDMTLARGRILRALGRPDDAIGVYLIDLDAFARCRGRASRADFDLGRARSVRSCARADRPGSRPGGATPPFGICARQTCVNAWETRRGQMRSDATYSSGFVRGSPTGPPRHSGCGRHVHSASSVGWMTPVDPFAGH